MAIVGKVNQETVRPEFRRTPHRCFRAYNLFYVAHQRAAFAAFRTQRMNDYLIGLAVNCEIVLSPIRRDFRRRVDHEVPIRKLPLMLILAFHATVDNAPVFRRIDIQGHRILFVIDEVHKDTATVEVCMTRIELRESSREIVGKNLVTNTNSISADSFDAPGLIVDARYWGFDPLTFANRWTAACGIEFLNILGEIKHRITSRRPPGHLKIKCVNFWSRGNLNFDIDFKEMRGRPRHCQTISDLQRLALGESAYDGRQQEETAQ